MRQKKTCAIPHRERCTYKNSVQYKHEFELQSPYLNNISGMVVLNQQKMIVWASSNMAYITGYSADELKEQNLEIFYANKDECDRVGNVLFNASAKHHAAAVDTVWINKARMTLNIHLTVLAFDGITFLTIQNSDKYKLLIEAKECFRAAMETSADGVVILQDEKHVYVNQKCAVIFGYDRPEEILGLAARILVHPDNRNKLIKDMKKRQIGERIVREYQFKGIRKDGLSVFIEVSATYIYFQGKPATLAFMRDITERKFSEKALKQTEERFRALVEKSREVIILTDANHKRLYVSPTVEAVLGYTVEEYLAMDKGDFTHPDYVASLNSNKKRMLACPDEMVVFKTRVRHKDGTWRWLENSACNRLNDASVRAIVINYHDITEQEEARLELEMKSHALEEVNTALKVLLEQRAKDINVIEDKIARNLKEMVLPYLEMLKQRHLDEEQRMYLSIIEDNLRNIVSPFIQKITSDYSDLTPTEVKVANFIRDGRTAKEIARIFNVSDNCINHHRQSIRNKLGLNNQKSSLRTYLMSLM